MRNSILKSKQGSALLVLVILLMILSILGVAMLSLTVSHSSYVQAGANAIRDKYSAESGLDEVYILIQEELKNTLREIAGKETETMQPGLEQAISEDLAKPVWNRELTDEYGSIREDRVKHYIQTQLFEPLFLTGFVKRVKHYFTEQVSGELWRTKSLREINGKYAEEDTLKQRIKKFEINTEQKTVTLEVEAAVSVHSASSGTGPLEKVIGMTYEIQIPEYGMMTEEEESYKTLNYKYLRKNVLWTKAIAAGQNLIAEEGASLTVNGDLYAYGAIDAETADGVKSGILADGDITIIGDVATNGFLLCRTPDASITVKPGLSAGGEGDELGLRGGEVFCNSLEIGEDADGSRIVINGNVSLYDDLELNGRGTVQIEGNYYGFGYQNDVANKSSSIFINYLPEEDDNTDYGITINGSGKAKSYYINPGYDFDGTGVFIAGTSYIGVNELDGLGEPVGPKYQTGESVSIRRNYLYYTEPQWMSMQDVYVDSNYSRVDFNSDNMRFSDFSHGLRLPVSILNPEINLMSKESVIFKSAYLKAISMREGVDLNLGKGTIHIENIRFSLGAYIASKADGEYELKNDKGGLISFQQISDSFRISQKEYNYKVNRMSDPQIVNFMEQPDEEENILNKKLEIEERFKLGDASKIYGELEIKNGEIIYSGDDANETIVIKGERADITDEDIAKKYPGCKFLEAGPELKGIMITLGSIYIVGDISFTGTLVADKDIIAGPGRIQVNNVYEDANIQESDNHVIKTVMDLGELRKFYDVEESGTVTYDIKFKQYSIVPEKYLLHNRVKARGWKAGK